MKPFYICGKCDLFLSHAGLHAQGVSPFCKNGVESNYFQHQPIPYKDDEIKRRLDDLILKTKPQVCYHAVTHDLRPDPIHTWVRTCSLCYEDIYGEQLD